MANENTPMTSTFSFTAPEWLTSLNGAGKIPYVAVPKEALGFTASRFQEQADHLKNLAACADLAEAMKCQFEFAQQSWSSFSEAWNVLDYLRMQSSPGSS
jgi:Phasin protein